MAEAWGPNSYTYYATPTSLPTSQLFNCGALVNFNCPPLLNNYVFNYACNAPCTTSMIVTLYNPSNTPMSSTNYPTGNAVINGNTLGINVNGTYRLVAYAYCNGLLCDSCVLNIRRTCPDTPPCCGGAWGPNSYTYYATPTSLPTSQLFNCGALVNFNCPPLLNNYVFNYACNAPCTTSMIVTLYNPSNTPMSSTNYPTGNAVINGNTLGINVNGTYRLVAYAYCNGLLCDSCVLNIRRTCPDTPPCCGGAWGPNSYTYYATPTSLPTSQLFNCGALVNFNCPPLLNNYVFNYACNAPCTTSMIVTLYNPSNTPMSSTNYPTGNAVINGNTLGINVNGTYRLVAYAYCNGLLCDSCVLNIRRTCPDTPPCCGGAWGPNSYTYYATPTSLPTSQLFNCSALVNFNCPPLLNNYVFNYACNAPCTTSMIVTLYNPSNTPMSSTNYPTGNAVINGNTLGINVNGTYRLVAYAYCNGLLCDSCVLNIRRTCPDTPPCCGSWGHITHNIYHDDGTSNMYSIDCGSSVNWNCPPLNNIYSFDYFCIAPCTTSFTGQLVNSSNSVVWNGNSVGTNWTINGTTSFGSLANGVYQLKIYSYCNGHLCDSCFIRIIVDCISDIPCCGNWGEVMVTQYDADGNSFMQAIECGSTINWNCPPLDNNFSFNYYCHSPCTTTFTGVLLNSSNVAVWSDNSIGSNWTFNGTSSFGTLSNGIYELVIYTYCNGHLCDSCIIRINVECSMDDHPCGSWGHIEYTATYEDGTQESFPVDCGSYIHYLCPPSDMQFTFEYFCNPSIPCNAVLVAELFDASSNLIWTGSVMSSIYVISGLPITSNGIYTLKVTSYCCGQYCDKCEIILDVNCFDMAAKSRTIKGQKSNAKKSSDIISIILNQNVPNPFAQNTSISYFIPETFTSAKLVFANSQGQVIKTLDIKELGKGIITVYADDLTSGQYSYSLVVDGKTIETKKMIKQ